MLTRRDALIMFASIAATKGSWAKDSQWPSRPITLVVPAPPGGTIDIIAREIAEDLRKAWGFPVIVDNRVGASGAIASLFVARAPADGHTLLLTMTSHLTNAVLNSKIGYDPIDSFSPVSLLLKSGAVVSVSSKSQINGWPDLLRLSKSGKSLSIGNWGNGTTTQIYGAMIAEEQQINLNQIPYKGEAQVMNDILSGTLDMGFISIPTFRGLANAGKVRGLAVTLSKRSPILPDLPTLAELGVPGPGKLSGWIGVLAPAGLPVQTREKLSEQFNKHILKAETRTKYMNEYGVQAEGSSPEEFGKILRSEYSEWVRMLKKYNIT